MIVPENVRFVLDGIVPARMQSAILLFVFQRRVEELLVRFEVVPNGEAVTVDRPAAGAAEPDFFPASDEVAMSKIPLPPGFGAVLPEFDDAGEDSSPPVCFGAVLPEFDDAGEDSSPPRELPDAPFCPVRVWATRAQLASTQKKAVSAMRILMCPYLSVVDCRPRAGCALVLDYKSITQMRKSKPFFRKNLNSGKKRVD